MVVSFLEIYCDCVRDLGKAYLSHGERTMSVEVSKATRVRDLISKLLGLMPLHL